MSEAFPALRNIDAAPVEHEGETFIAIQDPSGYVEEQLVLSAPAFFIAASLDGNRDMAALQAAFSEQFSGSTVAEAQVQEIIDYLDDQGFLLNRQFDAIRERVDGEFSKSDTRPAYLADRSYPADPDELRSFIDSFFTCEKGPGSAPASADGRKPLPGLIVPHIDFHRGMAGYAHGYGKLFSRPKPDVVFVFGVAHSGAPVPFILTRKHFDTPLGRVDTDQEIMTRLEGACAWDPYEWEGLHRTEHSIEFQAVMLAYHYGPDVKIVPILCSCFSMEPKPNVPAENEAVTTFLDECRAIVAESGGKVAVIAGADLAHVGKTFGDPFDIDDAVVADVAGRDHEDLAHIVDGNIDAEAFYASVMKDLNERKVCGLNCIYSTLKALDGTVSAGAMHHYDYAHDPNGGIVSFASVTLE
jgi:MEMO1 family protein